MGRRANAHNAHNAINALQSGGVVVVVGRRKLNIEFVECGVRNGFPKTCRRWFGSLAPAHSALAGLWLRPDPFRHLPGGSSPIVGTRLRFTTARRGCAFAQSGWRADIPRSIRRRSGHFAESTAVLGCVHLCSLMFGYVRICSDYGEKSF